MLQYKKTSVKNFPVHDFTSFLNLTLPNMWPYSDKTPRQPQIIAVISEFMTLLYIVITKKW